VLPDRVTRQRWLSRLLVAHPRVLARIDHARQWQAITRTTQRAVPQRNQHIGAAPAVRSSDATVTQATQQTHQQHSAVPQPTFAAIDTPLAIGDPVEDVPW
jgi:hypothetical protein